MTTYRPQTKTQKVVDYSLITAGSMLIGAVAGVVGLKAMTWVLNNHEPAENPHLTDFLLTASD